LDAANFLKSSARLETLLVLTAEIIGRGIGEKLGGGERVNVSCYTPRAWRSRQTVQVFFVMCWCFFVCQRPSRCSVARLSYTIRPNL